MSEQNVEQAPQWLLALRAALDTLPREYPDRYAQLTLMRHAVQNEFAAALQPSLNRHLQSLRQHTLEDKTRLTTTVNRELKALNLAVKCPVTQRPAILIADVRDSDRTSRFRFQSYDASGHLWKKGLMHRLSDLELVEAPSRTESLARRAPSDQPSSGKNAR